MNKSRFYFIKDVVLRENLEHCLGHITDLISVTNSQFFSEFKPIFFKTIVIYTASIIEAMLHHIALSQKLKYTAEEWKYDKLESFYVFEDKSEIIIAKRSKYQKSIGKRADFAAVNIACFENGLIDDKVFAELEKIREMRNKIHLTSLDEVDKNYTKATLNAIFETASKMIRLAEKYLK